MSRGGYRENNPTYKLKSGDRVIVAALYYMGLWTTAWIARAYNVTPKTVYNCKEAYRDLPAMFCLPAHPMYGKLVSLPAPKED